MTEGLSSFGARASAYAVLRNVGFVAIIIIIIIIINIIKWPMPLGARPRSIKNVNKIL